MLAQLPGVLSCSLSSKALISLGISALFERIRIFAKALHGATV